MLKSLSLVPAAALLLAALALTPVQAAQDGIMVSGDAAKVFDRSKPRVPGGSGCDDAEDIIEHPECR